MKTQNDGSFCDLKLTPKEVGRYQKYFDFHVFLTSEALENFLWVYNACYGYLKHSQNQKIQRMLNHVHPT